MSTISQRVLESIADCRTKFTGVARNLEAKGCKNVADTIDLRRYGNSIHLELFVEWVAKNGHELVLSFELSYQSGSWHISRSVSTRIEGGPDHFETVLALPDVDITADTVLVDRAPKLLDEMLRKFESVLNE